MNNLFILMKINRMAFVCFLLSTQQQERMQSKGHRICLEFSSSSTAHYKCKFDLKNNLKNIAHNCNKKTRERVLRVTITPSQKNYAVE